MSGALHFPLGVATTISCVTMLSKPGAGAVVNKPLNCTRCLLRSRITFGAVAGFPFFDYHSRVRSFVEPSALLLVFLC